MKKTIKRIILFIFIVIINSSPMAKIVGNVTFGNGWITGLRVTKVLAMGKALVLVRFETDDHMKSYPLSLNCRILVVADEDPYQAGFDPQKRPWIFKMLVTAQQMGTLVDVKVSDNYESCYLVSSSYFGIADIDIPLKVLNIDRIVIRNKYTEFDYFE